MIFGLGIDLIELTRIKKAIKNEYFIKKTFTENEYQQAKGKVSFLAGNFATKEALVKAFGTGFRNINLLDIEVLRNSQGKPHINLYNKALKLYQENLVSNIMVSISNTRTYAVSTVILEKD